MEGTRIQQVRGQRKRGYVTSPPGSIFDALLRSYAIESQFENVPGLSENFIYLNDDFFMTSPLTPISFYTSTYGLVLRMHSDLVVPPNKPNRIKGEWATMEQSNWLLSAYCILSAAHLPLTFAISTPF